ncbi:uncharacterized protein [Chelonus insularis]|uniref:uncharacterized protein n=1 Tax=Chelonus insularis TaxID=460826 RepID=UPI00158C31B9|nr:uncharacterized protein LOC118064422 [Chelonus insularis]
MSPTTPSTSRPTSLSTSMSTSLPSSPTTIPSPTTKPTPSITTPRTTTLSSEECICVPSYLCDEDGYIITNGEGIINPRLTSLPCSSANEVCCKVRNENNMLPLTNLKSTTKSSSTITSVATSSTTPTRPMTTSTMFTTTSTMSNTPMTTSSTVSSTTSQPSTSVQSSTDMCVCVLPSQCDSNGYVIVSGSGVIDPRFRQSRQSTNTCVPPEICCKLPSNNQDYGVIFPDDDQTQTSVAIDPRANLTSDIRNEGTTNACRCVKSASCTAGNEVELDAAGIIDPRFRLCFPLDEVCCKLKGIITMSTSTSSPTTTNSSKVVNKEPVPNSGEPLCGVPGPPCKPDECPTDDGSAYFAEFPWMVALLSRRDTGQALFLCGGSLIHVRAVLSATHCVLNSSRQKGTIVARVGEYNTLATNESAPFQEAEIQAIVTHPQYYSGGLYNDIAVLILQTPVNYAVNVVPICLPEKTTMFNAGTRCLASGWGKDGFDGKYQKVLQKIDLPIIDRNECLNRLRDTRLGKYFQLHSSFMCAGGEESKDTCTGDGGGPLVCSTPTGQFIQVGIVSWGIGCGESNVPAVYVNVAPFRSWIDQQLSSYGLLLRLGKPLGKKFTKMMKKLNTLGVILVLIIGLTTAAPQNDNLDDLIKSVFGTPSTTTTTTPSTNNRNDGTLDSLIDNVFNEKNTNNNVNNNNNNNDNGNTFPGTNNQQENDDDCECVPYYQCMNGSIVDDGIGLIDIRIRGVCENYLDICCKRPNIVDNENRVTPPPIIRRGCGQRRPEGVGFRITGQTDNEAQYAEFPWMVAVLREETVGSSGEKMNFYQCGGSLIHAQAVLTAAHCVASKTANQLKIRAGEWDTQTKNEPYPHQDRDIAKVIVHPDFHPGALRNDFAILILSQPVELAENVDVVCLPEQNELFDNDRCFASGWGKDQFGKDGHYQVILKRVEVPVVNHQSCQKLLRGTRLGNYFVLHSSFICAGGEPGKDTCKGDGGSPLACPLKSDPTRYAQAGIVAWGIGCGENGIPGVYANVADARGWINQMLYENNLFIEQ